MMIYRNEDQRPLRGTPRLPGSNSVAVRAILAASLCGPGETSIIRGVTLSDDARDAIRAAEGVLGADVCITGHDVSVTPTGQYPWYPTEVAGSATVARIVEKLGEVIGPRHPLVSYGLELGVRLRSDVPSPQASTGSMMAAPLLDTGAVVDCSDHSWSHIGLTAWVMRQFGLEVEFQESSRVAVHPGQYRSAVVDVPPDAGVAMYLAVAAILTPGSEIRLPCPRDTGYGLICPYGHQEESIGFGGS